jgi:hypothetical protein
MNRASANCTTTAVALCLLSFGDAAAQSLPDLKTLQFDAPAPAPAPEYHAPRDVLSANEWQRVDAAVARALVWLSRQQQPTGAFPSIDTGQPGVTALCVMAFVSHGHLPDDDMFGKQLRAAIDFTVGCQQENGLVSLAAPPGPIISRNVTHTIGTSTAYNHAISSLMLSEIYGMSDGEQAHRVQRAVSQALVASLAMQRWPKDHREDQGGWRYIHDYDDRDSDLSITGWELMFLRSARNAGFNVPKRAIDDAVSYVRGNFDRRFNTFRYTTGPLDTRSRGMAGAGVLALAHAGYHRSLEAQWAAAAIERNGFDAYNETMEVAPNWKHDRYHYGLFNCCQAMYQMGGEHWARFYPRVVRTLLANQSPDGSWAAESHHYDAQFGNAYTTALAVMTLGAPNQLLPVFQR